MQRPATIIATASILATMALAASAMPPEQIKQILEMTKDNWVSFRDYDGKQWIYFTHLESYACGIKQVRYSINSDDLDRTWELQPCDPDSPNTISKDVIYLTMPPGTAKSIALQLTYPDGSDSGVVHKSP